MSKIPSLLLSIILIGNVILIAETVRPENDPPELPVEILYPGTFESDGSELTEPDTVDVEGPGNSRYAAGGRGAIYDHGELGGSWHNELIDRVGIEYLNDTEVSGGRAGLRLWDIKPDGDCAGLWHLDDGTGANAADSSNNGNDGTVNGGLWSPGRFRTGLHLNGEGDGVTVRSSASLNITGELSLEGWVNGSELSRCDSVISKSTYSLGTNSEGRATFEVLEGHEALGRPGDIGHFAYCMVPFDGKLWAGTDDGGKVYCWDGSGQWVEVGKPHDTDKVFSMASYNGKLYAGSGKRPKVYRYDGGTTWTEVGQLDDCDHVISLAVYRGDLYAGTEGYASVYRYEGNGNWVRSDQLGDDENDEAYSLAVFGDKLFCGTRSPGVVWSFDGQTWVNSGQISDNNVETLTVYDGELYAGTYPDGDVHRYLGGDQWTSVGKPTGEDASVSLAVYAGRLYCGTYPNHGLYRYDGGQSWTEITSLSGVKFDSLAAFDGKLYAAGTDGDVVTVGDGLELLSSSTVDTGNFTHLAATYNGTTAVLYVDGEYDSSVNRSVTLGTSARHLSLGGSGDSRFGGRSGSGEDHLRGTLDDFAVWDRALSASEVRSRQRTSQEEPIVERLTSKSITRPRGMNWTRLTLSCETPPGTELRFTLVNASSNETIPGFADMDAREVDISGVPDGEIRLRAHLSGGGDLTPFLDSWSVEWKRADAWWDGFAGNGSLAGSEDIIYHNASAMPRYRELTGRNITASWNMAETEGFLVGDSSGKGLHGVLRNMEEGDWKEGIMDGALDFDGADEYVDLGAAHRLDIGVDDFTLEAWVNTTDAGPVSVIFSKGNANQEGYIWGLSGGKMSLWALTENGWAQYTGTGAYGDGRWHHLVLTREGTALRMYGDGTLDVGKTLSGWEILGSSDWNARIGGVAGQDWNYSGLVDRLTVYHRALSANEVEKSSFAFSENASLRSKSVLVRANNTWDAFRFSRTVPPGTWLNVTIFEGDTGEVIWWDNGTAPEGTADMSFLNVLETSLLFFGARLHSDGPSAPALLSWGINWTPYEQPRLISDLPNITLLEDTPALDILDISNHFRDVYGFISSPSYNRSQPSDGKNISLALDGSMVSVIRLADNWTGMVVVNFSCTNLYGLRALSNDVIIRVRGSNDVPCWKAAPPSVEFDEDGNETTDWSLDDYAFDIEGDELAFGVQAEDDNISASVDGDGRISVEAERDYLGISQMSVWAY